MSNAAATTAWPLSPIQRASLVYPARPVRVNLNAPLPPDVLAMRATRALSAVPHLAAETWKPPASRLPHQRPVEVSILPTSRGALSLVGGSLSITICPNGPISRITIEADALFVDMASIAGLCEAIANDDGSNFLESFFSIAAEHAAMLHAGDLDHERAYWKTKSGLVDPRSLLGVGPGTSDAGGALVATELPINLTGITPLAKACGVTTADVAYLALHLLVDRVCQPVGRIGCIADARDVMGLHGVLGCLSQAVPDAVEIDPDASARAQLVLQAERTRRNAEMAGGPSLAEGDQCPTLIFNPHTVWQLPEGWRILDAYEARSGAVLLRTSLDGPIHTLSAAVCDGTDKDALTRMLEAWAEVLTALIREPETPWRKLRLSGTLTGGIDSRSAKDPTRLEPVEDLCERIHALAIYDPDAVAVRQGDLNLSRQALSQRVSAIAAALGPLPLGAVVGVLADSDSDLLAGWIAVLWGGYAFLPLSSSEPPQRIADALAASGATAVLTAADSPAFDAPPSCRVVALDQITFESDGPDPPPMVDPNATAYLLRTSGSTGRPKFVVVSRASLNNYLHWAADELFASDDSALPVVSNPIFDASFKQLLGPQMAGRSTWFLVADPSDPAGTFEELVSTETPFYINCTPTYWSEILDLGVNAPERPQVARLLLGGEVVGEMLFERTLEQYPDTEIWNFYGPTETTATATVGRLSPGRPIHVGQPIAGAVVSVVDRYQRPLPAGLYGEIWIAGPGLAKGYIAQVEPNPFGALTLDEHATPAYRTGDIGSFDEDCNLTVTGRVDSQLKLNGWRIEPQEIERAACKVPNVTSAKLVIDDRQKIARLRLFYLGETDETVVSQVLRDWLPAVMIPSTVTRVSRYPRTTTGKLDEAALLKAVSARQEASPNDYNELELEVATVWRGLLEGGWPHRDEDFFSAGGHSLLLARLVNQLRARGHDSISLRLVVRNPSVQSIAEVIRECGTKPPGDVASQAS